MLVDSGDCAIDVEDLNVRAGGKGVKYLFPYALVSPPVIAYIDAVPVAEVFWQIAPRCAGTVNPEHGFEKEPIIPGGNPAICGLAREKVFDPGPLFVVEHHAFHASFRIREKLVLVCRLLYGKAFSLIENAL